MDRLTRVVLCLRPTEQNSLFRAGFSYRPPERRVLWLWRAVIFIRNGWGAFDNAAAETVVGLFVNEAMAKEYRLERGCCSPNDVAEIVVEWLLSYQNPRFHSTF